MSMIAGAQDSIVRASAVLTTSYVAGSVISHRGNKTLTLRCDFTKGNSDGFGFKIETSQDQITWYQEQQYSQAGGVTTHSDNVHERSAAANCNVKIDVYDVIGNYVRVSFKALGADATGSSLGVKATSSCLER